MIDCGPAAITLQNELDQIQMIQRRHLPEPFEIRNLASEDMIGIDRLQRLGCEIKIHRMAGLVMEIDGETGKNRVHALNAPKSPASMHTKAILGQLYQWLDVLPGQLPGGDQFFKLFSHTLNIKLACI